LKIINSKSYGTSSLKCLIYGQSGSGKTYAAKTTGENTLVISAESGLLSLADSNLDVIDLSVDDSGKPIVKEKRREKLQQTYRWLLEDAQIKKYRWIYIDSLTEIAQNFVEELNLEHPDRKDALVLWGEYAKRVRSFIKLFRDLPHYNVVFTALSTVTKDEAGRRYTGVDIQGKIASQLPAFFDLVFYLYCKENEETQKIDRFFLTQANEKIMAKDRSGKLNQFEEPNFKKIANKIRAKDNKGE
jgi:phage nucleotide-binding protein